MKVLNTPIRELTFADIVAFCKEKHIEGTQLDYKKDFSEKGLAKHIAAFSNTRGGIIIIGVAEDDKGLPTKWEGIPNDGKLIDRIHQYASNVEPFPKYEVSVTNEHNRNVFVLVRIFEGERTPYHVQNRSEIWVRVGNISSQATPDDLRLLIGKREQAKLARKLFIDTADETYYAALRRAERKRQQLSITENERNPQRGRGIQAPNSHVYNKRLGTDTAISTILLQPYYPSKVYIQPYDLKNVIDNDDLYVNTYRHFFPNPSRETVPEGILAFDWIETDKKFRCDQVYGQGLVFNVEDVLDIQGEYKRIWLQWIASQLYMVLLFTEKYYRKIGYQGTMVGYISLSTVEGVAMYPVGAGYPLSVNSALRDSYKWDFDVETNLLRDPVERLRFFVDLIGDIHVGLNYPPPTEDAIRSMLEEEGWLGK